MFWDMFRTCYEAGRTQNLRRHSALLSANIAASRSRIYYAAYDDDYPVCGKWVLAWQDSIAAQPPVRPAWRARPTAARGRVSARWSTRCRPRWRPPRARPRRASRPSAFKPRRRRRAHRLANHATPRMIQTPTIRLMTKLIIRVVPAMCETSLAITETPSSALANPRATLHVVLTYSLGLGR